MSLPIPFLRLLVQIEKEHRQPTFQIHIWIYI